MHILKTYQCVARDFHFCDICCEPICPGEMYEGSVEIHNKHFIIYKKHTSPSCDHPEDPDWIERERKEERKYQENLPLAA